MEAPVRDDQDADVSRAGQRESIMIKSLNISSVDWSRTTLKQQSPPADRESLLQSILNDDVWLSPMGCQGGGANKRRRLYRLQEQ